MAGIEVTQSLHLGPCTGRLGNPAEQSFLVRSPNVCKGSLVQFGLRLSDAIRYRLLRFRRLSIAKQCLVNKKFSSFCSLSSCVALKLVRLASMGVCVCAFVCQLDMGTVLLYSFHSLFDNASVSLAANQWSRKLRAQPPGLGYRLP
ncbi:unnamed protein product [Protopolystoma xenopodis]|uniref:Uncharacterized protein n=1 Tax=Protopolystoma xenopodis TaxID=117903 RepID=A0A3S5AEE7_9PLAT|nr:unnamed protein product [Protopolystoma xenopodis]